MASLVVVGVTRSQLEVRSPLAVQLVERTVALAQPAPHSLERLVGEIVIPECSEIGNAGLIRQVVEDGPVGRISFDGLDQPVANLL